MTLTMDRDTSVHDVSPRRKLDFEFDDEQEEQLLGDDSYESEEEKLIGVRYKELSILLNQLATRACMTEETYRIVKVGLLKLIEEIEAVLGNGTDMSPPLESKFVVQENALDEDGKTSNETMIRGLQNKEKTHLRSGKRPNSGLEMRKPKQINMSLSNHHAIIIEENNKQEYQDCWSNSYVAYPTENLSLSHVQPFQAAQTFNPIVQQPLNISPYYVRQDEHNGMSFTELLQQQLVKTRGIERFQWSDSTHESQPEEVYEERGEIPKR